MTYLKYYSLENRRHAAAEAVSGDFDMAKRMTDALADYFQVPRCQVELVSTAGQKGPRSRKVQSWYRGFGRTEKKIAYHPSMLTALTVAHEFAHYLHDLDKTQRLLALTVQALVCPETRRSFSEARNKINREHLHGPRHRELVNAAVVALRAHPEFGPMFKQP